MIYSGLTVLTKVGIMALTDRGSAWLTNTPSLLGSIVLRGEGHAYDFSKCKIALAVSGVCIGSAYIGSKISVKIDETTWGKNKKKTAKFAAYATLGAAVFGVCIYALKELY